MHPLLDIGVSLALGYMQRPAGLGLIALGKGMQTVGKELERTGEDLVRTAPPSGPFTPYSSAGTTSGRASCARPNSAAEPSGFRRGWGDYPRPA